MIGVAALVVHLVDLGLGGRTRRVVHPREERELLPHRVVDARDEVLRARLRVAPELRPDRGLREELAERLIDAPHATLPARLELLLSGDLLPQEEGLVLEGLRQRARLVVRDLPRPIE